MGAAVPEQGALLDLPAAGRGPRTVDGAGVIDPVARVVLDGVPAHLDRPFDYLIPPQFDASAKPGMRVQVTFAGREHSGYLLERGPDTDHVGELTPLRRVVGQVPVLTPQVLALAREVAAHYAGTLADVLRLAIPARHATTEIGECEKATEERTGVRRTLGGRGDQDVAGGGVAPTGGAGARPTVWDDLTGGPAYLRRLAAGEAPNAVWDALPGSRDQCLIEAAAAALAGGRGALLVVPTSRDVHAVAGALTLALPDEPVVQLLAEDGAARRYRSFLRVLLGRARIVVGTRAAAFAPLPEPGLLAVWDDGDPLLAEPRAPYPHAREVLARRARLEHASLLVGGWSRSVAAQDLVARGVAAPLSAPRHVVRLAVARVSAPAEVDLGRDGGAGHARLPPAAFTMARRALEDGPVLVQVARGGYVPVVACARCHEPARCHACAGPLRLEAPRGPAAGGAPRAGAPLQASAATCARCGRLAADWACVACGSDRLRARSVGSARTAEELGRAFPRIPVIASGTTADHGVVETIDATPRLVVATPGAEPLAQDGYAAALLLDAGVYTSRAELGATAEALRRWFHAASLVRAAGEGGQVMLLGHPARGAAQTLVRWDPAGAAERDYDERLALRLPPAAATAALEGPPDAVGDFLGRLDRQARGEAVEPPEVLGPVPVEARGRRGGGAATRLDGEDIVRAVVRSGRRSTSAARDLSRLLAATTAARSLRRERGAVRVRVDPEELW